MTTITSQNAPVQPERVAADSVAQYAERIALRYALPIGIAVGLLVVLLNLDRNPVPMSGDYRAFGTLLLIAIMPITLVVAGVAFVLGVRAWNERVAADRERTWRLAVVPVALAYALLIGLVTALGLQFVEFSFRDLTLDKFQGAFLVGAVASGLTLWVIQQVMQITTAKLLQLVFVIIGAGVYLTSATIDDPLWWQVSFSYLGTMKSSARTIFNITLIFTGVLLLVWLPFFMSDFRILVRHGVARKDAVRWMRIAFTALAIAIAFVGFFKSGLTPFSSLMHNWAAYSLAGIFAVLMLGLRWLVPGFSDEVFATSWTLMGGLVATLVLAAVGYFNTVGLEIICFVLGLLWLNVFVRSTSTLAEELEPEAFPIS